MSYRTLFKKNDFHAETQRFFANKTVCVPGGSGFVGSHLVEQLIELGAQPIVPTRQTEPVFLENSYENIELRYCQLEDPLQAKKCH